MRLVTSAAILMAGLSPVFAQPVSDSVIVPVPTTVQERSLLLEMCADASWAMRMKYDGACEAMRRKFEASERAAAAAKPVDPPKAADPTPCDPAKCPTAPLTEKKDDHQ